MLTENANQYLKKLNMLNKIYKKNTSLAAGITTSTLKSQS